MRGYIYTLFGFLLLVGVSITIYLNAESNRNINEHYNEMFRSEAITFTMESFNQDLIDNLINISIKYNLLLLTNHTAQYPISEPFSESKFSDILRDLVLEGSASGSYFVGNSGLNSPINVKSFINRTKAYAATKGVIVEYILGNFSIAQVDYNKLRYNYSIEIQIYDVYNKSGKILNISRRDIDFKIDGMPDPLFLRYAHIQRVDLRGMYPTIIVRDNPTVSVVVNGLFGQGWVYGRVYNDINQIRNRDEPNILIGDWSYVSQYKDHPMVDGIIITNFQYRTTERCRNSNPSIPTPLPPGVDTEENIFNDIVHEEIPEYGYDENGNQIIIGYRCERLPSRYPTNKNWIAVSSTIQNLDENDQNNPTILIITNNPIGMPESKYASPMILYRVESIRDFVNCGYYFKLPNNAPSYVQRFFNNAQRLRSPYGIDILIIEDDFLMSGVSSLLNERMMGMGQNIMKIRGLAGCKVLGQCDDRNATKISTSIASVLGIQDLLTNQR
ncbi:MAG: hypothetical protein N3C61_00015 [Candidatus Micrarchaeota archaeon]|nr:hypothetical protein [Candidatus Micrarchaeota archaeon]